MLGGKRPAHPCGVPGCAGGFRAPSRPGHWTHRDAIPARCVATACRALAFRANSTAMGAAEQPGFLRPLRPRVHLPISRPAVPRDHERQRRADREVLRGGDAAVQEQSGRLVVRAKAPVGERQPEEDRRRLRSSRRWRDGSGGSRTGAAMASRTADARWRAPTTSTAGARWRAASRSRSWPRGSRRPGAPTWPGRASGWLARIIHEPRAESARCASAARRSAGRTHLRWVPRNRVVHTMRTAAGRASQRMTRRSRSQAAGS